MAYPVEKLSLKWNTKSLSICFSFYIFKEGTYVSNLNNSLNCKTTSYVVPSLQKDVENPVFFSMSSRPVIKWMNYQHWFWEASYHSQIQYCRPALQGTTFEGCFSRRHSCTTHQWCSSWPHICAKHCAFPQHTCIAHMFPHHSCSIRLCLHHSHVPVPLSCARTTLMCLHHSSLSASFSCARTTLMCPYHSHVSAPLSCACTTPAALPSPDMHSAKTVPATAFAIAGTFPGLNVSALTTSANYATNCNKSCEDRCLENYKHKSNCHHSHHVTYIICAS